MIQKCKTFLNHFSHFHSQSCQYLHETDYRGYTMRKKRWAPDMERNIKDVLNIAKTPDEAVQYFKQQGLNHNDVALVMQRFYPNFSCNQLFQLNEQVVIGSHHRIPLSSHEQQLELMGFSQSVCSNRCLLFAVF